MTRGTLAVSVVCWGCYEVVVDVVGVDIDDGVIHVDADDANVITARNLLEWGVRADLAEGTRCS